MAVIDKLMHARAPQRIINNVVLTSLEPDRCQVARQVIILQSRVRLRCLTQTPRFFRAHSKTESGIKGNSKFLNKLPSENGLTPLFSSSLMAFGFWIEQRVLRNNKFHCKSTIIISSEPPEPITINTPLTLKCS